MSSTQANVRSVDTIADFRVQYINFCDAAKDALAAVTMDGRRILDWMTHDQARYWDDALRRAWDDVAMWKNALARKRMMRMNGRVPDTSEEEKELSMAKRRVEIATEKIEVVKRNVRVVQKALDEYESAARRLYDLTEGSPPQGAVALERMAVALEAYLNIEAPGSSGPIAPPIEGGVL